MAETFTVPSTGFYARVDGGGQEYRKAGEVIPITLAALLGMTTEATPEPGGDPEALRADLGAFTFNVRRFGAKGNGVSDDTAAIQRAINAANWAGGGVVFFPSGTYLLRGRRTGSWSAILIARSNVTLRGEGYQSALKVADGYTAGGDYRVLAPYGAEALDNFRLEELRFDGNAANNLVLGSSGANVRRAYVLYCDHGQNLHVRRCWFENQPGRNVLVFGNNGATPSCKDVWIDGNRFRYLGGAIAGNELQNDHSTIYSQADGGHVTDNEFWAADAPWNPDATAVRVVTALEIHGSNTEVSGNTARYFTHGGNAVGYAHESRGNRWHHNNLLDCTKLGISLWTSAAYAIRDLTIDHNLIRIDGQYGAAVAGIYQSLAANVTGSPIEGLAIEGNTICGADETARANVWHGVLLCAVDGGSVVRNRIRHVQGCGVLLNADAVFALNCNDVAIDDNDIENVGLNTLVTYLWGVALINASAVAGQVFRDVRIDRNRIRKDAAAGNMRGIRIEGPGAIWDVEVGGRNRFRNIADPTALIQQLSTANFRRIEVLPRDARTAGSTSDPTAGVFVAGQDVVWHTSVTLGQSAGKMVTATGGLSEAAWAAATAYVAGQWIRTSGLKVLECIVGGTSGGAEPNPTTLGQAVTDGTVTWAYRATSQAALKPFGQVGYDEGFLTLTNNSATPSVSRGKNFYATNSSATSITDFTNGGNGQTIVVFATNGNTTLVQGTTIKLRGGVNVTLAAGQAVTLVRRETGEWDETARNF